jgi:Family of unknown function (DUF6356)
MSHLKDRQISYLKHLRFASGAGFVLLQAGIISIVHGIFPSVFIGYSEKKTLALARLAKQRNDKIYSKT